MSHPSQARRSSSWLREAVALATAALLGLLLLAAAFSRAWPHLLLVGQEDTRFVQGFHDPEQFAGIANGRWSKPVAELALPRPPAVPVVLQLRLHVGRPPDQPGPQIRLSVDGQPAATFNALQRIDGTRRYYLLVPNQPRLDWAMRFAFTIEPLVVPGDQRELGVVVSTAQLLPLAPLRIPPLFTSLCALAIGALSYGCVRLTGASTWAGMLTSLALALLVAWGVATRPLELLPYLQRLALLPALGSAGLLLVRLLLPLSPAAPGPASNQSPADRLPHLAGISLPIMLGLGWWLALAFQVLIKLDGAQAIYPASLAQYTGLALGSALLLIGGWSYWKHGGATMTTVRWALALCALAAAIMIIDQVRFAFSRQAPDFWILFKGARAWTRGGSLYDLEAVYTNHFGHVFKVPPFYGMFFVPFVTLGGEQVLFFHRLLNLLLISASTLLWIWMVRPADYRRTALIVVASSLIMLNFRPLYDTLAYGQIDLLLLFLLTLALWALQERRELLAGGLIALGALFKIYPVLLLAFLVMKGHWRGLAGFVLGMLLANGLALLVMGWEMHRVYLTEVLPNIGGTTAWIESQTLASFVARWFAPPTHAEIFAERTLTLMAMAGSAGLVLLASLLSLRPAEAHRPAYALQYGQFLLLMVLAVPAAWMHYETLLLLVFAALLWNYRDSTISLPQAGLIALSFALIGFGNQWSFFGGTVNGVLTLLGLSHKFFGMLLLGWALVWAIMQTTAAPHLPVPMRATVVWKYLRLR